VKLRSILFSCALTLSVLAISSPAHADTWTYTNTNPETNAYIDNSYPQFTLNSANTYGAFTNVIPNISYYTTTVEAPETFTYDWHFSESYFLAGWLEAGYVVNGVKTQLNPYQGRSYPQITDGTETINLQAGDVFGFYLVSSEERVPPLTAALSIDITSSVATTPEPGTIMLLGTGLMSMAGVMRRRFTSQS